MRRSWSPRSGLLAATAAFALAGSALVQYPARADGPSPAPLCVPRTAPAQPGLSAITSTSVGGDPRLRDFTMHSTALGSPGAPGTVHVEVLLPPSYDSTAGTRYPVLYLLHGHGGSYRDWALHGVEHLVDAVKPDVIVVMPDGGYDGFYSDWYGTDVDGHNGTVAPGWETFHLSELLPWVDATFATIGTRSARAVAGLSMGGFGSASYAARHPDLFSAVGTFSGATDNDLDHPVGAEVQPLASNAPDRRPPDNCIWGDPVVSDVTWQAHNPAELAPNLSSVATSIWYGDGRPGDTSPGAPAWSPGAGATEAGIGQENDTFVAALRAAGEHPVVDAYGAGTHDWFYWTRDLGQFLRALPASFFTGGRPATVQPFTYESAEPTFSVWGWSFGADHPAPGFTYLSAVSPRGFDVRGSGRLHVVTPLTARKNVTVTLTNETSRSRSVVPVSRDKATGRLAFTVALEAPHPLPQVLFGPTGETTTFPTLFHVSISVERP